MDGEQKMQGASKTSELPVEQDQNIIQRLRFWAGANPDKIAYRFMPKGVRGPSEELTYQMLLAHAESVAEQLRHAAEVGDRAVLWFEPGLEFAVAFYACLLSGITAVPIAPVASRSKIGSLVGIINDAEAKVLVTSLGSRSFAAIFPEFSLPSIVVDLSAEPTEAFRGEYRPKSTDIAFLQYTSGSTSAPKGVIVGHANIVHNQELIRRSVCTTADDIGVSWLPFHHDMGLMGGIIQPVFCGMTVNLIAPASFLRDPFIWLEAISELRGTLSPAPNFAYDLAVRQVNDEQWASLDLSSWRVAVSGAEPVRAMTLERFVNRFADRGFRRATFMPAYGMAETTLLVAATQADLPPSTLAVASESFLSAGSKVHEKAQLLVSCGKPAGNTEVAIVDPISKRQLADDEKGEIWLRGGSVALGYWRKPQQTEEVFKAEISGRPDLGQWLRTGDLGFIHRGEIFINGRAKNLIIVRGRNIQAEDVELAAIQSSPLLQSSDAAAFSQEAAADQGELLILLVEISRTTLGSEDPKALLQQVREAVATKLDVQPAIIALVPRGALPRTTSGKVQRHLTRDRFVGGMVVMIASDGVAQDGTGDLGISASLVQEEADDATIDLVRSIAAACLKLPAGQIESNRPLTVYGMDSLAAAQLHGGLCDVFGAEIDLADLFECNTINALAKRFAVARSQGGRPAAPAITSLVSSDKSSFPLTELQQAYIIGRGNSLAGGGVGLQGYIEIECAVLDLARFSQAWNDLVARHEMLRAVCDRIDGQRILEAVSSYAPSTVDCRGSGPEEAEATIAEIRATISHKVAPLEAWPQFEIVVVTHDAGVRLCMRVDGTFIDLHSFGILARDFAALYRGMPAVPSPTGPGRRFADHVELLQQERETKSYARSLDWWRQRLRSLPPAPQLPLRATVREAGVPRFDRRSCRVEGARWAKMQSLVAEAGCTRASFLLTAYAQVIARWSQSLQFTLNVPIANRRDTRFLETVGNFSSFTLLGFDFARPMTFAEQLRATQAEMMACLQHQAVAGMTLVRERLATAGALASATMPIVFTEAPFVPGAESGIERDFAGAVGGKVVWEITQTPQVWLDCQVRYERDAVVINWDFVADQYPADVVDSMFSAFETLLNDLEEPSAWQRFSFDLLPDAQREVRDELIRSTDVEEGSLFTMVYERAVRSPDATAVIDGAGSWTYAELIDAALVLASAVPAAGDTAIAVALPKGRHQIAAVLASLATGAPYLPVDTSWPEARITACLLDSGCRRLITSREIASRLVLPSGVVIVQVDADQVELAVPEKAAEPLTGELAYILYTSGSTGAPKGVKITQRSVINAIRETNANFGIGSADRVLGLTELHHDMSVFDIFGVLAAGGGLVLPDPYRRKDPEHWLDLIHRHRISIWNSVPALLEMLTIFVEAAPDAKSPTTLRLFFVGGDWIPLSLPERVGAWRNESKFVSVGGPTETTLWNIWHEVGELPHDWSSVPYGRPIANTRYFILNERDEDSPDWVAGEMCVAGLGVTPGYVTEGEREHSKFGRHPLTGERIYRTGDLGRFRPGGLIEFLGRTDYQIKIRGVRIEPGEVEGMLVEHEDIEQAAVVSVGDGGNARLTACVVPTASARERAIVKIDREEQLRGMAAALAVDGSENVISDPGQRIQFKIDDRSLRRDFEGGGIGLRGAVQSEQLPRDLLRRQSYRTFGQAAFSCESLGLLLESLRRAKYPGVPFPKMLYPSAGGLYPVQVYLYIKPERISGIGAGYYYYDPQEHRLFPTFEDEDPADAYVGYLAPTFDSAAFALFLVADLEAIAPMYGERSRDFCLIEGGYMGQLLSEAAPYFDIGLCPIGAVAFDDIASRLRLGDRHLLIHSLLGGHIEASQKVIWDVVTTGGVAPSPGSQAWCQSVRDLLCARLPASLVPSELLVIDALPLSANGKVDRRAIADLFAIKTCLPDDVTPLNDVESQIAIAIQDVMGSEQNIGPNVNFFDLGANSLHLVQLQAKLMSTIGGSFSVVDIFEHSTVRRLAAHLSAKTVESVAPADNSTQRAQRQRDAMRRQRRQYTR